MNDARRAERRGPVDPDAGFPVMSVEEFGRLSDALAPTANIAYALKTSVRNVQRWENGTAAIPGMVAVAMRLMVERPPVGIANQLPADVVHKFDPMPAGDFLRLRQSIGTQLEAAVEMETARKSLGRWERGERPVPGPAAVAMALLAARAADRRRMTEDVAKSMSKTGGGK